MKLELTKEQFDHLLKAVFLGNWVVNATKDPEDREKRYEDLFLNLVEQAQYKHLNSEHSPFDAFQDDIEIQEFLEDYAEDVFWEELIERLSKRDLIHLLGEEEDEDVDLEALNAVADGIALKYLEEFENNGLENVTVKNIDLEDFEIDLLPD